MHGGRSRGEKNLEMKREALKENRGIGIFYYDADMNMAGLAVKLNLLFNWTKETWSLQRVMTTFADYFWL